MSRSTSGGSTDLEQDRSLALHAEMRLPGEAWLEWTIDPDGEGTHRRADRAVQAAGVVRDAPTGTACCRSTRWCSRGSCTGSCTTPSRSSPRRPRPLPRDVASTTLRYPCDELRDRHERSVRSVAVTDPETAPDPRPSKLRPFDAAALVFVCSAAVLMLEILAGRLLAPYVGISLETYTSIIGTVLAGIAVGAWAGGKLADRIDPRRLLGPTVALGGLLALFTVPIVRSLGDQSSEGGRAPTLVPRLRRLLPPRRRAQRGHADGREAAAPRPPHAPVASSGG